MMGSQFPTEGEAVDDDYFVRLLAFMWRCRGLCVLVLAMGAVAGVATQSRSLPFRTTLAHSCVLQNATLNSPPSSHTPQEVKLTSRG